MLKVMLPVSWLAVILAANAGAQNPGGTPSPAPTPVRVSPQEHLAAAARELAAVSDKSQPQATQKNLAQLRKDFETLTTTYKRSALTPNIWLPAMYDVERDLVLLIGGGGIETTQTKAMPGLSPQVSDASTREALAAFRTHLELFFDVATALPASLISNDEGKTRDPHSS